MNTLIFVSGFTLALIIKLCTTIKRYLDMAYPEEEDKE